MGKLDFKAINEACRVRLASLLETWLPGGRVNGNEYVCGNLNGGTGRSLSVNMRTGIWKDFATGDRGSDPVSLYAAINGLGQGEAARRLIQELGINGEHERSRIVANYDYHDASGTLLFQVVRFRPKDFRQRRPDGKGGWIWNVRGIELIPYRLPEVLQCEEVFIVEGEKDADHLFALGLTASSNVQGAGRWRDEYSKWFAGKLVRILPDNDEAGRKHAHDVATSLGATAEEVRIITLPGLPNKGDVSDWLDNGGSKAQLLQLVESAPRWMPEADRSTASMQPQSSSNTPWQIARELFPRKAFPWQVLPTELASSLQQLARSCAGSPNPLPGYAFCLMAAAIGHTLTVEAKESWQEPLIFWCLDIRDSGDGKTSPMWKLARLLEERQKHEHTRYDIEMARWEQLPKKERSKALQPPAPRGFFASDVTVEGLHADLQGHPTGGVALLLNEASSLLTSQGQYKAGRGADREAWLLLWDGNDVRIVRAGETSYIHGARIQVAGGIQPAIFTRVFSSENGMYLADGTVFRGLFSYEPSTHYGLTDESWRIEKSRDAWESTLDNALAWAGKYVGNTSHILRLNTEALALLISWRNERDIIKTALPQALRGFIPKSVFYALRLAGVLHCIRAFSRNENPTNQIDNNTMRQGIEVAEYYLGQAVDAVQLLTEGTAQPPVEVSDRTVRLALVLKDMRSDIDNGRLAIGFIRERYNAAASQEAQIQSPHAMGALLRSAGLSISTSRHHANGKKGVYCLEWDEKIEKFINKCPQNPHSPQDKAPCGFSTEDLGNLQSSKSTSLPDDECTSRTSKKPSPSSRIPNNTESVDYEDNEDFLQREFWSAPTEWTPGKSEQASLKDGESLAVVSATNSLMPKGQPTLRGHSHSGAGQGLRPLEPLNGEEQKHEPR